MARAKTSKTATTVTPVEETSTGVETEVAVLQDTDEIEVVSLIPNVSYLDNKTGDYYRWERVDDSETMTFAVLKDMRRSAKTYFNELWLKPLDERVIKYFKLERVYRAYDELMDISAYSKDRIVDTCNKIAASPNGIKWTLCGKIKQFVVDGEIADIKVLRALEKQLNVDLVDLL